MKRPLFMVALWYVSGILAARMIPLSPTLLLSSTLAWAVVVLTWTKMRPALLGPMVLLTGWTNLTLHTAVISPNDLRSVLGTEPVLATVRGRLCQTPSLRVYEQSGPPAWRTVTEIDTLALRLEGQSWRAAHGRIAVTTPGALSRYFAGQLVEVRGVAAHPRTAVAEGMFDYRKYLEQQGIYYALQAGSEEDWQVLVSPRRAPLADRFRAWAQRALARGLPGEDESLRLEWALTLGWKTALTEDVSEPFIQAATFHIFAVDGLRMAIIFGIFFGLFRAAGLSRSVAGAALIPLIWFYVSLTGWPASAIRATVMLTIVIVGWVLNRPVDLLNSLFAAAVIILTWDPRQLFQAGFQLSFLVVLCMILILPPLRKQLERRIAPETLVPEKLRPRWRQRLHARTRWLSDLLLTSLAAWLGSLPLVACYFHIVTPISTPANVVAVPLCGLVLMSNLGSLLSVNWLPPVAELFNHAGWFLMECIRLSSRWFAGWPWAYWYVRTPHLFATVLYYAALLGCFTGWLLKPKLRVWKLACLGLGVGLWGGLLWRQTASTRLTMLPANGGTVVYFDGPARQDMLVDCGTTNSVEMLTKPFLRAQGVNGLTKLVMTHGDLRHIGGAGVIAEAFPTGRVCASPVRFRSPVYRRLLQTFDRKPGLVRIVSRGDSLGAWQVLHPEPEDHFSQADDSALVLEAVLGTTRVLLLSDLGRTGQNVLRERNPNLRTDIVIAGLPSTGEALSDWLLDALQPKVIVITDSEFPASERASTALRQRLRHRNVPVIYTRLMGAATIEFAKNHWELHTMNGTRIRSQDLAQSH